MIKIERSPNPPESLKEKKKYDGKDVVLLLKHDFYDKCYICGIKPVQDPEIEHLLPHKNGTYPERKFDWNNLFFSCSHCNSVKKQSKHDKNVLDCCKRDPEELLDFKINRENVLIDVKDNKDIEAKTTANLVNEVFNKTNTGMRIHKCQVRVDELLKEMNTLYDILEKYQGGNCSVIIRHSLKGLLDRKSPFAEFKRSYIRHQKDRYPELMRFIN